jgi:immune inhibitor A
MWSTSGTSNIGRIGVISHENETDHFFGLPDLYDGSGGSGIGYFCLMANSWGFDNSQYYPPAMSAWAKLALGWVTAKEISTSGSYTARQGCNFQDIFIIKKNFQAGENLLIENRQQCGFDAIIQGPGLAIFHIDDSASYTTEGYPGLTNWPRDHYRVALLQADGNYNLEKGINRGDGTDLFFHPHVTGISNSGTSSGKANPNTKGYRGELLKLQASLSNI